MLQNQTKPQRIHVGRVGWFAIGALAASLVFVAMLVAGDFFKAVSSDDTVQADPPLVIEGK